MAKRPAVVKMEFHKDGAEPRNSCAPAGATEQFLRGPRPARLPRKRGGFPAGAGGICGRFGRPNSVLPRAGWGRARVGTGPGRIASQASGQGLRPARQRQKAVGTICACLWRRVQKPWTEPERQRREDARARPVENTIKCRRRRE